MANESNIEPDDIKSIPTFRAAYSDRTALLMAKLAYRAYEKFDKDDDAFGAFQQDFTDLASSIAPAWLTPMSGRRVTWRRAPTSLWWRSAAPRTCSTGGRT
jgi:hypothetical protein